MSDKEKLRASAIEHEQNGYPFPPPHSMAWENGGLHGVSYDLAVQLYHEQNDKHKSMNLNPVKSPAQKVHEQNRFKVVLEPR